MIEEDMTEMENEVSKLAHELQAEVEKICAKLDADDPLVVKLRNAAANTSRGIDEARELRIDYPPPGRSRRQLDPIYSWEKLPMYDWINEFARIIGRLLAVLPKRHYIYAHNLAGQATLISNCIAGGHRDSAPGEVIPPEELRAYLFIGYQATFTTAQLLEDLAAVTKLGSAERARGAALIGQIRQQFEIDLASSGGAVEAIH